MGRPALLWIRRLESLSHREDAKSAKAIGREKNAGGNRKDGIKRIVNGL
jgi:hypothetical protein